jgi:hypothetical protein
MFVEEEKRSIAKYVMYGQELYSECLFKPGYQYCYRRGRPHANLAIEFPFPEIIKQTAGRKLWRD